MKRFLVIVFALVSFTASAADLPNPALTPGAVMERRAETVCVSGYAHRVRDVPASLKHKVYQRYGMKGNDRSKCPEGYEVDHLIPLTIGGSNAVENLWAQSYCGDWNAHHKDRLELRLHKLVCDGEISLREAQKCIKEDWIKCYRKYFDK